jgi:hypothetical protein
VDVVGIRLLRDYSQWDSGHLDCAYRVSAFYKGESQEKKLPGDWKEQRFLPGSPAHVMLGGSWGFLFSQSHVVVVTTPSVSDATSSTVAKIANHGSI